MTNQIFEISVRSFDLEDNKTRNLFRIFGLDNAIRQGLEFGICDNVEMVEVVDISTGEIMLIVEDKEITWLAND